jgi:hypothetical protein
LQGNFFARLSEYKFEDWIVEFIRMHRDTPNSDPQTLADALYAKMRKTFEPVDVFLQHDEGSDYSPGDRFVTYIVAGYAKNSKNFLLFELWAEINTKGDGLRYAAPVRHQRELPQDLYLGEHEFILRAQQGREPESSIRQRVWFTCVDSVSSVLPNIPEALQDAIASVVSLIKVEAQFNPNKVGSTVYAAVISSVSLRYPSPNHHAQSLSSRACSCAGRRSEGSVFVFRSL